MQTPALIAMLSNWLPRFLSINLWNLQPPLIVGGRVKKPVLLGAISLKQPGPQPPLGAWACTDSRTNYHIK